MNGGYEYSSMLMAILKVHRVKGLWIMNGGYEYSLVLLANALLIGFGGPGTYALDNAWRMPWPEAVAFAVTLIISLIVVALGLMSAQSESPHQTQAPQSS